jgi:mono/diheme cytochrome c family protein
MSESKMKSLSPIVPAGLLCVGLLACAGCGHPQVEFVLNREGQTPFDEIEERLRDTIKKHNAAEEKRAEEAQEKGTEYEPALRDADQEVQEERDRRALHDQAIVDVLYTMFGDPSEPWAWGGANVSGLDQKKLRFAAGAADDPTGRGLYRKHCVHCHGITGDGNGPTAAFLNPFPRDFRYGMFKFKSTAPESARPTREDLQHTISEGINGTAMPSFKVLLRSDEIEALAEYVVYLSLRGRTEILLRDPTNDAGIVDDNIQLKDIELEDGGWALDKLQELYASKVIRGVVELGEFDVWKQASGQVFTPPPRDEAAIAKEDGYKLFAGAPGPDGKNRVECTKCHGNNALGDGDSAAQTFDKWNEPKWKLAQAGNSPSDIAQRFDLPLQRLQPRNLRLGIYRGGRRPVDLFRRIAVGVLPSGMPAHASIKRDEQDEDKDGNTDELVMASAPDKLQPHEIWALVDYVLSLPYQEDGELRRDRVAEGPVLERH